MAVDRDAGGAPTQGDIESIPALIGDLFRVVRALSAACPGRPFTPDGHLVGSIGEVVAAYAYGLVLEPCSTKGYDATTVDGQRVEIKLTGGNGVWVSSDPATPDLLVVLRLDPTSGFEEIYNGDFPYGLWASKKASKRRVVSLRLTDLRARNPHLLVQEHPLEELNQLFTADATEMSQGTQ
jgi:hypothetical protein